jgi:hypothetical protein
VLYIPQHRLCIVRQKAFWGSERSRHWPSCLEGNIPFRLQFLFFRSASIPFGRGDLRIVGHNADSAPHLPLAKCNTAAVRAPVSRRAETQACRESVLLRRAFSLLLGARTTPQHSRACESKFGRNEQILGALIVAIIIAVLWLRHSLMPSYGWIFILFVAAISFAKRDWRR